MSTELVLSRQSHIDSHVDSYRNTYLRSSNLKDEVLCKIAFDIDGKT